MVFHPDAIHLEVRDDGVGFDRELSGGSHELGSGFGLIGMEQRARQLGGTIVVSSKKGQGTVVEAKIPTV
jgi:signal transduction histidine kinase